MKTKIKKRRVFSGLLVALLLWIAIDLSVVRRVDIRDFDPDEVARLDNAMWRSYYSREPVRMFFQLAGLMRSQYHFPFFKSNLVAYYAGRSAFVFKKGSDRAEYREALPDLIRYYSCLKEISTSGFDVQRASELELEWWIVHRDRQKYQPGDLGRAVAEAAAEFYQVPLERLMQYGEYRADAMVIRDEKAKEKGGVTEEDWGRIESLLQKSWASLWTNVHG